MKGYSRWEIVALVVLCLIVLFSIFYNKPEKKSLEPKVLQKDTLTPVTYYIRADKDSLYLYMSTWDGEDEFLGARSWHENAKVGIDSLITRNIEELR